MLFRFVFLGNMPPGDPLLLLPYGLARGTQYHPGNPLHPPWAESLLSQVPALPLPWFTKLVWLGYLSVLLLFYCHYIIAFITKLY